MPEYLADGMAKMDFVMGKSKDEENKKEVR